MTFLYGSYNDADEFSTWKPKRQKSFPHGWPDQVKVHELLDASYVEAGRSAHLLVTWAKPEETMEGEYSCHGCGVLIGLARFTKDSNGWRADAEDLQYGEYGEWGYAPTIYLQPLGPEHFGLMMDTSFSSGGVYEEFETILIPEDGKFETAFSQQVAQTWDEDGCSGTVTSKRAESCIAYEGGISCVPETGSEYYDLLLTKRVYKSLSKKAPLGITITRFHFSGTRYIAAKQD